MTAAKDSNMLLMFLLELGVLFSVGLWGFTLNAGLAIRLLAGIGGVAAALFAAGRAVPALVFAGLFVLNAVLRLVWKQV